MASETPAFDQNGMRRLRGEVKDYQNRGWSGENSTRRYCRRVLVK